MRIDPRKINPTLVTGDFSLHNEANNINVEVMQSLVRLSNKTHLAT